MKCSESKNGSRTYLEVEGARGGPLVERRILQTLLAQTIELWKEVRNVSPEFPRTS